MGLIAVAVAIAPPARAQDESDVQRAAAEYEAGRRAYQEKRYSDAGMHFEDAYGAVPRAEALRNAIRTRTMAKELDRAASLAAIAEKRYATDAPTMVLVRDVLGEATVRLARVDVTCAPACTLKVDGVAPPFADTPAEQFRIYLKPGSRSLEARFAGRGVQATSIDAAAGGREEWKVEPAPEEAKPDKPTTGGPATKELPPPAAAPEKPLPKGVFFTGAALTAIGLTTTIVFYVDQKRVEREEVAAYVDGCEDPDCPDGSLSKMARRKTFITALVTGGVLVGTGVVGLFFTRWTGNDPAPASRSNSLVAPFVIPLREGAAMGLSGRF
jgi:hypothetical protein